MTGQLTGLMSVGVTVKISSNENGNAIVYILGFRKLDNERSQPVSKKNPDGQHEDDSKRTIRNR